MTPPSPPRPRFSSRRQWPVRLFPPALIAGALLAGCTVGPDYTIPGPDSLPGGTEVGFAAAGYAPPESPDAGGSADSITPSPGSDSPPAPDGRWWTVLGDPGLVDLMTLALAQNLELEAARARVRQARAARRAAAGAGRPELGAATSGNRSRASRNTPEGALAEAGLTELEVERYDLGLSASWELDLFGGVRRSVEAARARVDEAEAGRHGVTLAVVAETARAYVELRGLERRLALAAENLELQQETVGRVEGLHRVGLGSRLEVEQARALYEGTRSRLPPLRAEIRATAHRLAVLTGRPPGSLVEQLLASNGSSRGSTGATKQAPLADPPDLVPVGLPSDLLRRRPDLLAAERRLAARSAEIGVATARLYPRFFLTGGGGTEGGSFADLFDSASRTWTLGPSISWPILRGGRLRAGVEAAEAAHQAAWAEYRQAFLEAVEDVETALVRYAEEALRRRALAESARAAAEAARLARVVYERGLESFLTVLDAERTLVAVEDDLARSETALLLRLVGLYTALGGGWQAADPPPATSAGEGLARNRDRDETRGDARDPAPGDTPG
ncbi:MAG: efflux transporter outer membrane subunit [Holophagales bacterium]|nr:efflux transporter outer membrane subunit [Holophagales bacterium]